MNPLKQASNLYKSLEINRTVLALSIARAGDAMANSILFVVIPLEVAEFSDTSSTFPLPLIVGVLISVYGLANAGLQPFTAALSDRIGHYKFILQAGLILVGITTLAFVFADRYLHLLGLRIVQGFGVALQIPPTMALLAILTRQRTRGGSMGFYTTMRMLGYVLGPLLGGLIYHYLGLNAAFIAGTIILLLAVVVVQFWVEDKPASGVAAGRRFRIIDPVLLTPSIISAGLAAFLIGSAFIMITSLENEFNSRLNISAFGFGIAFSFLMIGRVLFQVPLGRFSDRFGRKPFIFCGLLLLSPVTVLVGQAASLLQIILLRFAQGVAAAAIVAPALAMAADLSLPGGQSRQISIVPMGYGLGIACGPLLAGALSWVSFELPFWVAGLLSLAGAWLVYRNMLETVRPTGGGRSAAL